MEIAVAISASHTHNTVLDFILIVPNYLGPILTHQCSQGIQPPDYLRNTMAHSLVKHIIDTGEITAKIHNATKEKKKKDTQNL